MGKIETREQFINRMIADARAKGTLKEYEENNDPPPASLHELYRHNDFLNRLWGYR